MKLKGVGGRGLSGHGNVCHKEAIRFILLTHICVISDLKNK